MDAVDAMIANARRLYEDGVLLLENDRYPTARSIAILAMEECGKAAMLDLSDDGGHRRHREKQRSFGRRRFAMEVVYALSERGWQIEPNEDGDLSDTVQSSPERQEAVPEVVRQALSSAHLTAGSIITEAEAGEYESLKQRGFYVDIALNGDVISAPGEDDGDLAYEETQAYLDLVADWLEAFELTAGSHPAVAVIEATRADRDAK